MKIVKPDNLALLTTPVRLEGTPHLAIAALACFCLDGPAAPPMLPEAELWQTALAALDDGQVLDQGYPKPRAEFVVHGAARAVRPTTGQEIAVGVGPLSKTLAFTGDRFWTAPGAPGRPAGLGPIPADHPQRQALLGRFDAAWLAERWPDLPRDASPEYFHTAPEDQRLQGFFRGDEEIRLSGLHPEKPTIISGLPRLRARLFVTQTQGAATAFLEVPNRAETLMLYPERLRGILLFRGTLPVADEALDDIVCLTADWEALTDAAQPVEKYFERTQAALNPAPEPDLEPPAPPAADTASEASAPPPALPGMDALHQAVAELEAENDQRLAALGLTREALLQQYGPEAGEPEAPSLERLAAEIAQLEQHTDERLGPLGIGREELIARHDPAQAEAPADPAALQAQVRELLAQAQALPAAKLSATEFAPHLPPAPEGEPPSVAAAEAALERWATQTAGTPPPAEEEDASRPGTTAMKAAEALARHRAGGSLGRIDAGGEDFSGCDLRGADFSQALLDRAVFAGAQLQGAIFTGAVLQGADLRGADLSAAVLQGAAGPSADLSEARLAGADLTAGDWTGANFSRADLKAATLSRAILRKADLTDAVLQGAAALDTDFSEANLSRADGRGCDLTGADCSGAVLTQARLADLRAPGLHLFGATAEGTDLRNACLRGLRGGPGTLLNGARLGGADLSAACLGGAHFIDVDLEGAALDGGDFSRAIFQRTNLRNVTARESNFLKAAIEASDLRGIDLLQGSLRQARLATVDLRDASLYGVDFYGASLKATDTRGANLKGTLLTPTQQG
jgi:uncharacterized protein YjbI with pentapeptide repeats